MAWSFTTCSDFHLNFSFSHTNSPIESYNATIKLSFTCRLKYNMIPACQIMQDIIIYESEKNFDYKTFGVSTKLMRDKAYKLISN